MIFLPELIKKIDQDREMAEIKVKRDVLLPFLRCFRQDRIFPYLRFLHGLAASIEDSHFYGEGSESSIFHSSVLENPRTVQSFLADLYKDLTEEVIKVGEARCADIENKLDVELLDGKQFAQESGWLIVCDSCYQSYDGCGHRVFYYRAGHVRSSDPRSFHDILLSQKGKMLERMRPSRVRPYLISRTSIDDSDSFCIIKPANSGKLRYSFSRAIRGVAQSMIFQEVRISSQ